MKRKSRRYDNPPPTVIVDWQLAVNDRAAARRAVAEKWLAETPYTKYRYNVERCADGNLVYLLRPTWLNKGFDFMVNVEGFRSRTRTPKGPSKEMPSHPDIIQDLSQKVVAKPEHAELWFAAVCAIYDCEEPGSIIARYGDIGSGYGHGLAPDELLYIVKWLFIEQDVTYWARTGRDMLMAAMETEVFSSVIEA